MAGLLSAIGGAISGVGQGLTAQAEEDGKAKREARLMELQHGYRMQEQGAQNDFTSKRDATLNQFQTDRDVRQNDFQTQRDERQHGYRIGEIGAQGASTQANTRLSNDLQSQREERSRTWERERLGIAGDQQTQRDERQHGYKLEEIEKTADAKARGKDDGDLTPADQRELNLARQSNINPITKQVDWLAAYRQLKGNGRDDLAQRLVAGEGGAVTDAIRKEAQKRAEAEADGRAGWFSTDSSDFKDDGGDRSAFIKRRTGELVQQEMGGGTERTGGARPTPSAAPSPSSSAAAPAAQGEAPSVAKPPAGKGTQAEPFQAASQSDIEWFKTSAPKGAVIIVNGKPFTK
ncbi:hypothetical protein ACHMW5_02255 [Azospirillum melinis]|uniref:hypothetical protein n=1 Tax=Azospirillum melinis TaxID=328839 RepID=UPI003756EF1C